LLDIHITLASFLYTAVDSVLYVE